MKAVAQEAYRRLTIDVYTRWCPEKLENLPAIFKKYEGQEDDVYDKAVRLYVFQDQPRSEWLPLIEGMYRRFSPSKLDTLDNLLKKYSGSEAGLFKALCDKYIPTLGPDDATLQLCDWGCSSRGRFADRVNRRGEDESMGSVSPCSPQRGSCSRSRSPQLRQGSIKLVPRGELAATRTELPAPRTRHVADEAIRHSVKKSRRVSNGAAPLVDAAKKVGEQPEVRKRKRTHKAVGSTSVQQSLSTSGDPLANGVQASLGAVASSQEASKSVSGSPVGLPSGLDVPLKPPVSAAVAPPVRGPAAGVRKPLPKPKQRPSPAQSIGEAQKLGSVPTPPTPAVPASHVADVVKAVPPVVEDVIHNELLGAEALQAFVSAAPQVDRTAKKRPKRLKAMVEYDGQQLEFEISVKTTLAELGTMYSTWIGARCAPGSFG